MKRRSWFVVILFLLGIKNLSEAEAAPIKVGSSPVVSSAGIYLALEKGFFKEQGLDVEVVDIVNSGAPMTLLLSKGELDVGAGNLSSGLFNAVSQGHKFKLVADKGHISRATDYIVLLVREDHLRSGRYKDFSSLKGFKMGLTSLDGVSQQALAERFLAKAGLGGKDVEYIKLSYSEMNAALKSKSLDATIQLEPFVTQAELGGFARVVARGAEVHDKQQSAALFYSPHFIEKRHEDGIKFMIAYLKGVRLYNKSLKDPTTKREVVSLLKKRIKIVDDRVWEKMTPVGLADNGRLKVKTLQEDLDWYLKRGYLKKPLSAENVVDQTFVDEAVKRMNGK